MTWMDDIQKSLPVTEGPGKVYVVHVRSQSRLYTDLEEYVYVGRAFGEDVQSPLGNPFPIPKSHVPGATLAAYRKWLRDTASDPETEQHQEVTRLLNLLREGRDVALACWCHDLSSCHAEVLLEYLNSRL